MIVRRLRPDEWPELRALRLRALATDPDAFGSTLADAEAHPEEVWQRRASDRGSPVFVAESDGALVGMAIGAPAPDDRPAAGLFAMWVAPEARRRGIGTRLVEAVTAWARDAGYPAIGLGVTPGDTAAIALYERMGFADIGERFPLRDGSDVEVIAMGKVLPAEP